MVNAIKLSTNHPVYAKLTPLLAERIAAYATDHDRLQSPEIVVKHFMGRLWAGDQRLLCIVLVDDENGDIVGHLIAEVIVDQNKPYIVNIKQLRADQNVDNAMIDAVNTIVDWGKSVGCKHFVLEAHDDGRKWCKRIPGLSRVRSILHMSLEGAIVATDDN